MGTLPDPERPVRPSAIARDAALPESPGPYARPGASVPGPRADYDVIVVGGGPAGSETARRLAGAGFTVLVLEEHRVLGEPVQCAGLLATNVFPLIDLDPYGPFHQQEIRGAHINAPGGRHVLIEAPRVHAHAVSRAGFDQALAARAEQVGAEIVRGATFIDSEAERLPLAGGANGDARGAVRRVVTVRHRDEDGRATRTTIRCLLLVGADGVGSEVARTSGFAAPRHVLPGLEIELEGLDIPDPHNVHVHTGADVAPGYFAWIVPKGRHGARVGLCLDIHRARGRHALQCYEEYLKRPDVAAITAGGHEVYRIVGCIPLGLRRRLVADGVLLVGDAGGFAKPTSGGGIYMASWGAKLVAETVSKTLRSGRTDADALAPFERAVWRTIGRELTVGAALHEVFRRMRDEELDHLAARLDHPGVLKTIERHGDIDHPSRLVMPMLMRRPSLLRYAWPAARALVSTRLART